MSVSTLYFFTCNHLSPALKVLSDVVSRLQCLYLCIGVKTIVCLLWMFHIRVLFYVV